MSFRRLKDLLPDVVRDWYRRRSRSREIDERRNHHSGLLKNEVFPHQLTQVRAKCSAGLTATLEPLLLGFDPSSNQKPLVAVRWDDAPHELYVRANTSDVAVLLQVFLDKQYEPALRTLQKRQDAAFIDCGANVGFASRFLLDALPSRKAVLIEPCSNNIAVCKRNLAPYVTQTTLVHGALWRMDGFDFDLMDPGLLEWGIRCEVSSNASGKPGNAKTYTMASLINLLGESPVGLIKIDIEGGEKAVFESEDLEWIAHAGSIAMEIHGEACERAVLKGMKGYDFERDKRGEIDMFTNISTLDSETPQAG